MALKLLCNDSNAMVIIYFFVSFLVLIVSEYAKHDRIGIRKRFFPSFLFFQIIGGAYFSISVFLLFLFFSFLLFSTLSFSLYLPQGR